MYISMYRASTKPDHFAKEFLTYVLLAIMHPVAHWLQVQKVDRKHFSFSASL